MQAAADIIQRIADDRLRRQGSEKFAAVGFGQDAVIQYDQRAPIGIGADQASAALAEFDLKGENVFFLPKDAAIVKGTREALTKIGLLDGEN